MQFDINRFLKIRTGYGPSFSPDGKSLVYLTDTTGVQQVWKVNTENPVPEQISYLDDRVTLASYSPVAHRLIVAMDSGGDENMQLFLLDDDGVTCEPLTNQPDVMHVFCGWSPDGSQIAYSANARHRTYFDLYVMDMATRQSTMVLENHVQGRITALWMSGQSLVAFLVESSSRQTVFHVDLSARSARKVLETTDETSLGQAEPDPRRQRLYVTTYLGRDFKGVVTLDLSGNLESVRTPDWDVEGLALSPDGRHLAYVVNEDGYSVLHLMDTSTGEELPLPTLPRGVIGIAGVVEDSGLLFSPDGKRLAVTFSSAKHNTDIWLLGVEEQTFTRLTKSSTAGIPQSVFVEPELIRYRTFDKRLIPAFVYWPPAPKQTLLPSIAWVHGGPESQSRPGFNAVIQYFVNRGYVVFVPNVRGSTGYGREYCHLDDRRKRMDSVADLAYGIKWLKAQPGIDPDKVAVQGGSYGGFMVLSSITTYPELFAAAVDFFGIGNWETFLLNTSPYRRKNREAEYGNLEEDLEFLREISPAHHVDKIRCPLLVIQGKKDPRVPFSESEQMVERIRARGGVVEPIYFEDEGHGIVKLQNRIVAWGQMADFLERHMLRS